MKPKPLVNYNGRLNRILDEFFVQNVYFLMISVHFDWLTSFGPFSETIASWEQKFWLVADLESYFHVCHWWWHCDPSIAATFERSWCHPCSNCCTEIQSQNHMNCQYIRCCHTLNRHRVSTQSLNHFVLHHRESFDYEVHLIVPALSHCTVSRFSYLMEVL